MLFLGEELRVFRCADEVLDGGMSEDGNCVAEKEEDEAPGKEVSRYEEEAGCTEENNV